MTTATFLFLIFLCIAFVATCGLLLLFKHGAPPRPKDEFLKRHGIDENY